MLQMKIKVLQWKYNINGSIIASLVVYQLLSGFHINNAGFWTLSKSYMAETMGNKARFWHMPFHKELVADLSNACLERTSQFGHPVPHIELELELHPLCITRGMTVAG